MTIFEQDQHPGRCRNLRPHRSSDGHVEYLRCFDMDRDEHVCWFPRPTHVPVPMSGGSMQAYKLPTPVPWVRPDVRSGAPAEALSVTSLKAEEPE